MRRTRRGRILKWWHKWQGHMVVRTVVRDYRRPFADVWYFRDGWLCVHCHKTWGC